MAGKKGQDNSKKVAGQARKAETAAQKAAAEEAKKAAAEAAETAGSVPSCDISCLHISAPTFLRSLALPLEAPLPLLWTSVWLFYPVRTIKGTCAAAKLPLMRSPYRTGGTDTLVGWMGWAIRALAATCEVRIFAQMDYNFRDKTDLSNRTDYTLSYREAEAAKKAEAARKKAEKEALLKEEEKNTPGRTQPKNAKSAVKKTRGLDLSQLDDDGSGPLAALNASGIDNALDALSLTTSSAVDKIDRHPERRFKAAYAAFEERRLAEMEKDGSGQGLRLNQKKEKIKKEFEKHPDNPFNQVTARYDASREELAQLKEQERIKIESRLGSRR
ncbi:hypothetical protein QBC45DRAFT_448366 [Copromyces sp. CBS 386.78]|nr:hypothetical protein QBC45DRAFT_448366 [Copromyces sp. CBS 386.78]